MDIFNKKKIKDLKEQIKLLKVQLNNTIQKLEDNKTSNEETKQKLLNKLEEFKDVDDIRKAVKTEFNKLDTIKKQINSLKESYKSGKETYDLLKKEVSSFENALEMASFGIYEPTFNFDTSEKFKEEITLNKIKQKELIKNNEAANCLTEWTIEGSATKGKQMVDRKIKLMLRAFNGECDALISKVKWNNYTSVSNRIFKSFSAINTLGKSEHIRLLPEYLSLKLDELNLTYEYHLKKQEEKEEKREINARIREEEKAQRDYEKAQKQAESEEKRYRKALEKAKKDLGLVDGEELSKLNSKIKELEQNLAESQREKERALSMAQQTKSGYVYIISNIGSFGKDIYKIGLTRRLEPLDRVRELGDASVPFKFDVHAMIYSEDAPRLENQIHKLLKDKSLNLVNFRKEFFKVSLKEVMEIVKSNFDKDVEFVEIPEAQEYRETMNIIESFNKKPEIEEEKYPSELLL